jgi:hypothetical protein
VPAFEQLPHELRALLSQSLVCELLRTDRGLPRDPHLCSRILRYGISLSRPPETVFKTTCQGCMSGFV